MSHLRTFGIADPGQSLVEIALALPLLLITLLGLVDVGRAYIYSTAVTNAAREAAVFAARTGYTVADPTHGGEVALRACNETGFGAYSTTTPTVTVSGGVGTATCAGGEVVTSRTCLDATAGDANVSVSYQFNLVSGYLFRSILGRDSLVASGCASFRSLQ